MSPVMWSVCRILCRRGRRHSDVIVDGDGGLAVTLLLAEVGMQGDGDDPAVSRGEQIQAAEREAAKQRILALAEAERIPAEEIPRAVPDRRWRRGQR
jgi:hypothetical protein